MTIGYTDGSHVLPVHRLFIHTENELHIIFGVQISQIILH